MNIPETVKEKLRLLPDKPGCYLMRDARGRIIYVGKAISLRKRVMSYFRDASLRRGSPKLRGMVRSVGDLEVIVLRNEAEALLTEGRLIKEYKPRYNVSFRDDKRFPLLSADPDEPLPRFRLMRLQRHDNRRYFGPYTSSAAARAALDFVEKNFGLRKCKPRTPNAETYRHCLNDIVRFCSAPCVERIAPADYRIRFEEACSFLRGERPADLQPLREAMQNAAAEMNFERAAALRDSLFLLQAAVRRQARVASTPAMRKHDADAGIAELQDALGLPSLPRTIEGYDISTISGTLSVASMVCAVDGLPARTRYRRFRIRTVEGMDDPAMMAEVIGRRFERAQEERTPLPDLVMVDGGATQVKAASAELARLAVRGVEVAGLAKRFEEIHRPGLESPIRLPKDSRALHVLQRLRDEAHRFALAYHQRLRTRRLQDSVLDDIPGIGAHRRAQLLQRFGSVRRLSAAAPDDVAAVPGIGRAMATLILQSLSKEEPGP
jgi:excinuclease ABC subunit C